MTGGSASGTTSGRSNTITASCAGFVMNGTDAVYQIEAAASASLTVSIAAGYAANAYVLASCDVAPATPACLGNSFATTTSPLAVTAGAAGAYFIVVDDGNASLAGSYTLTVAAP